MSWILYDDGRPLQNSASSGVRAIGIEPIEGSAVVMLLPDGSLVENGRYKTGHRRNPVRFHWMYKDHFHQWVLEQFARVSRPPSSPTLPAEKFDPAALFADLYKRGIFVSKPMDCVDFQKQVKAWIIECLGENDFSNPAQRNISMLEKFLELAQASGMSRAIALRMVDYVWDRPAGDLKQEVGGVMTTLAVFCEAHAVNMFEEAQKELLSIQEPARMVKIREKAKAKPNFLADYISPQDEPALRELFLLLNELFALKPTLGVSPQRRELMGKLLGREIKTHLSRFGYLFKDELYSINHLLIQTLSHTTDAVTVAPCCFNTIEVVFGNPALTQSYQEHTLVVSARIAKLEKLMSARYQATSP